MEATEVFRP